MLVGEGGACALRMDSVVREMQAQELTELGVQELGAGIQALNRLVNQAQAELSRWVRAFEHRQGYAADGSHSMTGWLIDNCRMAGGMAAQAVHLGRTLEELPLTREALRSGEISHRHAVMISMTAERIGIEAVLEGEADLVRYAREFTPDSYRWVIHRFRHCFDADGSFDEEKDSFKKRWLEVTRTFDGTVAIEGRLDAESGELLRKALDSLMTPAGRVDERSACHRRADALVELCERQLSGGRLPASGGVRPHLSVNTTLETLLGATMTEPATLGDGMPLSLETARRLACDCTITRVLLDSRSMPIDVGRATRVIPATMRRALMARDGNCCWPGCDAPPQFSEAHHVTHWLHGGETRLENLVLLCRRHHRRLHDEGWRIHRDEESRLQFVDPSPSPSPWARAPAA